MSWGGLYRQVLDTKENSIPFLEDLIQCCHGYEEIASTPESQRLSSVVVSKGECAEPP